MSMLRFFSSLLSRKQKTPDTKKQQTESPGIENSQGELSTVESIFLRSSKRGENLTRDEIVYINTWIKERVGSGCPDCQQGELMEGPSGGFSMNVQCSHCGSKFNFSFAFGGQGQVFEVQRISEVSPKLQTTEKESAMTNQNRLTDQQLNEIADELEENVKTMTAEERKAPFFSTEEEEHTIDQVIDEIRQGTEFGRELAASHLKLKAVNEKK